MKRVYHTWDEWECYPAGFYEVRPPAPLDAEEARLLYAEFLRNTPRFRAALSRLPVEWPNSTEHYLSNERMNRIAWLGQAAACIDTGLPSAFRGGYFHLSEDERHTADLTALELLNEWLTSRGEPTVDLVGAGTKAKVDLY